MLDQRRYHHHVLAGRWLVILHVHRLPGSLIRLSLAGQEEWLTFLFVLYESVLFVNTTAAHASEPKARRHTRAQGMKMAST